MAFVKSDRAGMVGGLSHFGFRLTTPDDMDEALKSVKAIGAHIVRSKEYSPGCTFLYINDPDGYELEI